MKVTDPAGRTWAVSRRWLPAQARSARERAGRHLRRSRHAVDVADAVSWFDELVPLLVAVAVVAGLVVFFATGLPLLIEAVVLVLLTALGIVSRVVLRRPWTVEAVSGDRRIERAVVGWRASGDEVAALGDAIRHGRAS